LVEGRLGRLVRNQFGWKPHWRERRGHGGNMERCLGTTCSFQLRKRIAEESGVTRGPDHASGKDPTSHVSCREP